jgi:hypothetical protein
MIGKTKYTWVEMLSIKPNYCVSYMVNLDRVYRNNSFKLPPAKNEQAPTNEISEKSKRRLLTALDWMLLISKEKKVSSIKKKGKFKYKLAMVTLTLPSAQMHDDNFIKKNMLGLFLDWLRKEHNCQLYIWKAEKQENLNIHFHIIINKYIRHEEINKKWNSICNRHDYINQYRTNMVNHHRNGFNPETDSKDKRTITQKYESYVKGVRENWSNPTSTTDIHSLKKVKNARAYLGKYVSKNPDETKYLKDFCEKFKKFYDVDEIHPINMEQIKKEVKEKYKIQGHIWYISHALSAMKGCMLDLEDKFKEELRYLHTNFADKIKELDRCTVYNFDIITLWKLKLKNIVTNFGNYIWELRAKMKYRCDDLFSSMGIPIDNFKMKIA